MAKEIGNWGKPAKPKSTKASAVSEQSAAAVLIANKLDPNEKLLWASYGSGTRKLSARIVVNAVMSVFIGTIIATILKGLASNMPLAETVNSLSWGVLVLPIYVAYRAYAGPQFEAYALTDLRAVVLQRDFPFFLETCEILALRVDEGLAGTGNVRFGRIAPPPPSARSGYPEWFDKQTSPEPGFYGIARPRDVANLIETHLLEPSEELADAAGSSASDLLVDNAST